ncbi:RagB/SusD family nutrient uptake outer membrane protein [Fibrella aquatilis]|uniref:RagB/SusD family nutrient uptake outer membrane protein n=1 Tax=Fibrella aquatilis TaxID=2817059 RepID=A0A939K2H3_9BACT|nr:RagB/SusD family nutrient uptake outer membrane protein [Fibrella aquatilis]MBO0934568.1 RagB/SusD family nutrient uptake outer membrane protein [Fibrella aquatilis]
MKKIIISALSLVLLSQMACQTPEYLNPSTISQSQAVSSPDGLITLCNGLQFRYSTGGALSILYNATAGAGLTTRELSVLNVGNIEEANLATGGGNVNNGNGVVRNLWTQSQLVRANAELILANTAVTDNDPGTKSGIVGYAAIFKALSLGTLAQFFEQAPITTGTNAPFVPRIQVLQEAIRTLEAAATQLAAAPVSANFTGKIVPGIDIPNTIQALIARYALLAGDNDKALAAAAKVVLTSKSVFNFDDLTRNPLFEATFGNLNNYQPTNASLGLTGALAPDPADKRLAFLTKVSSNTAVSPVVASAYYTANNAAVPVYLPGEMGLIRAEAFARKGDLANAIVELNKVRTKTAAQDAFGLGAGLPAYAPSGDTPVTADGVLLEIYKNRLVELAFQGFRLEDSRRFNRPGPGATGAERNRNFFPYPRTERDNNASTPADPGV